MDHGVTPSNAIVCGNENGQNTFFCRSFYEVRSNSSVLVSAALADVETTDRASCVCVSILWEVFSTDRSAEDYGTVVAGSTQAVIVHNGHEVSVIPIS